MAGTATSTTPASAPAQRPPLAKRGAAASTTRPGGVAQPRRRRSSTPHGSASVDSGGGTSAASASASASGLSRAQALRAFLSCVGDEMCAVIEAFQAAEERHLGAFKTLWRARRMSALFHVEFWDSTPTDTHHAILQVALGCLLNGISNVSHESDAPALVLRVTGHLFALYCAFSVQVSEPKVKIATDPAAWQTLTQLRPLLLTWLADPEHARIAHEALAVLRMLEHEERAFLKCVGGSVAEFRPSVRAGYQPTLDLREAVASVPERSTDEKEEMALRLDALSAHYNATLKSLSLAGQRTDDPGATATASRPSTGRGLARGRAAPTFLRKSRPTPQTHGQSDVGAEAIADGLWSEEREAVASAWLARFRQSLNSQPDPDLHEINTSSADAADESETFDGSSDAFDYAAPSDLDDALLALEQELVREDDHVPPEPLRATATEHGALPLTPLPSAPVPRTGGVPASHATHHVTRHKRALSIASNGQNSDGLDELESELPRGVGSTETMQPMPRSTRAVMETATSRAAVSMPSRKLTSRISGPTEPRSSVTSPAPVKQTRRSRRSMSVASSGQESDGLADLEAELERDVSMDNSHTVTNKTQHPPALPPTTTQIAAPVRRRTRARAASVISIDTESDGLDELEVELNREIHQTATTSQSKIEKPTNFATSNSQRPGGAQCRHAKVPSAQDERRSRQQMQREVSTVEESSLPRQEPVAQTTARFSSRLSSRSSDVGSVDELQHLQLELDAAVVLSSTTNSPRELVRAAAKSRKRPGTSNPASKYARPGKKPALQALDEPYELPLRRSRRHSIASSARAVSDADLAALNAELSMEPQQLRHQRPRSASVLSSTTESDEELKQLEQELAASTERTIPSPAAVATARKPRSKPPAPIARKQTSDAVSKPRNKSDSVKRPRQPRGPHQQKPSKPRAPAMLQTASVERVAITPAIPTSSRHSVASSYDSDGLDELEKELNTVV